MLRRSDGAPRLGSPDRNLPTVVTLCRECDTAGFVQPRRELFLPAPQQRRCGAPSGHHLREAFAISQLASRGRPLDSTKSFLRQNRKPRSGALCTARPAEKAAANIGMAGAPKQRIAYMDRLSRFAVICDESGLAVFERLRQKRLRLSKASFQFGRDRSRGRPRCGGWTSSSRYARRCRRPWESSRRRW
jgi:hypothetical protein